MSSATRCPGRSARRVNPAMQGVTAEQRPDGHQPVPIEVPHAYPLGVQMEKPDRSSGLGEHTVIERDTQQIERRPL
jgi:hypothetical protein